MKSYLVPILAVCLLLGCKTEKKSEPQVPKKEATLLEKLAQANGYDHWKNVKELKFTFNVDRDTAHSERSWVWNTRTNKVTAISASDTLDYDRANMDSIATKANRGFINDKYWLLAPINIIWDQNNLTQTYTAEAQAPISKKPMQKLTVVYGNEGGYTPGDAYDFYFGDDYMVKEWVFRRGNQADPSTTTTWEDYVDKGGLKIARTHKNEDGSFKLYFTDIEVKTD